MEHQTDQPRERITFYNDGTHGPPQEPYPDPPPAYEEYNIKTSNNGLYHGEMIPQPIQEQPQPNTTRIVSISQGTGACGGMPELLLAASLVLSIICLFVFPCVLACTLPAVAISIGAKDALRRGNVNAGKCQIWTGAILDVVAILLAIGFVAVMVALQVRE